MLLAGFRLTVNSVELDQEFPVQGRGKRERFTRRPFGRTAKFCPAAIFTGVTTSLGRKSPDLIPPALWTFPPLEKSIASACREAGIKYGGIDGLTPHCLRHSAAHRLVNGKLPVQFMARILGHTQTHVTTYRYLSAIDETLREAASIFESVQTENDFEPPNQFDFVGESKLVN